MDEPAQLDLSASLKSTRDRLNNLPSSDPYVANLKEGLTCFELASAFYEEANRAIKANAWFAAAAVAAAALEAVLLGKMFVHRDDVVQLAKFRRLLHRHKGNFGMFARQEMNLGRLLDIAKELAWFRSGGVPTLLTDMLVEHAGENTVKELAVFFKDSYSAGYASADLLRQYRNLLHPASCLREGIQITQETGIRATLFCLVAFVSLTSN